MAVENKSSSRRPGTTAKRSTGSSNGGSSSGASSRRTRASSNGSGSSQKSGSSSAAKRPASSSAAKRPASSSAAKRPASNSAAKRPGSSSAAKRPSASRAPKASGSGASQRAKSSGARSSSGAGATATPARRAQRSASNRLEGLFNSRTLSDTASTGSELVRTAIDKAAIPVATAAAGVAGGLILGRTALRNRKTLGVPVPASKRKIDFGGITQGLGEAGRQFGKLAREVQAVREKAERVGRAIS